jgi:hypothetical protein
MRVNRAGKRDGVPPVSSPPDYRQPERWTIFSMIRSSRASIALRGVLDSPESLEHSAVKLRAALADVRLTSADSPVNV